ncbi:MAG: zf-HC2 domain-containing protein [Treponema sp.]|nr:zf-HC2 domain-containing protein [Treponema sp.]
MFTCPTNEIHSLYLDNELPQNHKAEYEAHIASCEKCRAELEKLRALRDVFAKDAADINPDKAFMDASFERLMLKMKYTKTTSRMHMNSPRGRVWKFAVPALAAAAVLALVIPFGLGAGRHGVKTMSATSSIYSQIPSQVSEQMADVAFGGENGFAFSNAVQQVMPSTVKNVNNVSNASGAASRLIKDVEVFRPKFESDGEEKTISIRITIPGNDDVPVTTEIEVPLDVTGQY